MQADFTVPIYKAEVAEAVIKAAASPCLSVTLQTTTAG